MRSSQASRWSGAVVAAVLLGTGAASRADCVDDAAQYHLVNSWVLRAILWNESGMKATAVNRNANGTVDVGIGQINSIHFGALRDHGVSPDHLKNACVGTYVAAWHLKKQTIQYGNTWRAVGAYHSVTPHFNQSYANRVHATLVRWRAIAPGPPPFPRVAPPPAAAHPSVTLRQANASPLSALASD